MSRFLEEIPLGDLDLQPQAWTAERLRGREARRAASGASSSRWPRWRRPVRWSATPTLMVAPHAPRLADIGDTLVLPDHRGHRLGLA